MLGGPDAELESITKVIDGWMDGWMVGWMDGLTDGIAGLEIEPMLLSAK